MAYKNIPKAWDKDLFKVIRCNKNNKNIFILLTCLCISETKHSAGASEGGGKISPSGVGYCLWQSWHRGGEKLEAKLPNLWDWRHSKSSCWAAPLQLLLQSSPPGCTNTATTRIPSVELVFELCCANLWFSGETVGKESSSMNPSQTC